MLSGEPAIGYDSRLVTKSREYSKKWGTEMSSENPSKKRELSLKSNNASRGRLLSSSAKSTVIPSVKFTLAGSKARAKTSITREARSEMTGCDTQRINTVAAASISYWLSCAYATERRREKRVCGSMRSHVYACDRVSSSHQYTDDRSRSNNVALQAVAPERRYKASFETRRN